jgi:hypothetical protein
MSSSPTISIFSAHPESDRQPYTFAVSFLAHGVAIALVLLGVISAPRMKPTAIAERYAVRHLDLESLYPEVQRAAAGAIHAPNSHAKTHELPKGGSADAEQSVMRQMIAAPPGRQTLIQPDIPKPAPLNVEIPVPTVVLWNAANAPAKVILAPQQQRPPVADMKPAIIKPNREQRLADVAIPSVNQPSLTQSILPSTTSPLIVQGPKPTPPAPITTAAGSAQPTAATVMSLSETHMAKGNVTLPPVNLSASTNSQGAVAAGHAKDSSQAGHGNPAGKAAGKSGESGAATASAGSGNSANHTGAGQGSNSGSVLGNIPGTTRIVQPKEGQFGSVVVGSSLEEKYPETAEIWSGRMSYTVYLHVGLAKSWILQYTLSRSDSATAAVQHIEAPWPYNIVRPNIAPGAIDADALMVHGFVNQAGRFEALAIAFPPGFAEAQFVLNALAQWQFRPATQNGQSVKVEVLLIIPEIPE